MKSIYEVVDIIRNQVEEKMNEKEKEESGDLSKGEAKEIKIKISVERHSDNRIALYLERHRKGRQIWLEKRGHIIALRDRWFYMDGGWKDISYQEFSDGLLKEEQAARTAISMLAVQIIDSDSSVVKMLGEASQ